MPRTRRVAAVNRLYLLALASVGLVVVLSVFMFRGDRILAWMASRGADSTESSGESEPGKKSTQPAKDPGSKQQLLMYCAAGMRYAMDEIVADYQREHGVSVELQYGGSNTLLSQIEVSGTGDLYLAADDSYIAMAREKGLCAESIPLATMRPVIIVHRDNPKKIESVADLLRPEVKVALGNPDAAAVGKTTRELLESSGHWKELESHVTANGVFKPTVNEVANDVKLGSVHAGIVWDSTSAQYPELRAIRVPELDRGQVLIEITVLKSTKSPTSSLRFARYVTARDRGLRTFRKAGFDVVDGDIWAEKPEITFYAGAVNRRALDPVIKQFEQREGVTVNTVYNGCGILTAQMRSIQEEKSRAFPDTYMACDVYYLQTVQDLFEQGVNVSDTDIVIVVPKGNPKNIQSLADLANPNVRVTLGQPQQCTIGALSRRLLENEGIYDDVKKNVVQEAPTSAMLVPNITTGAADAALAYHTDTLAERSKLEVIPIESSLAKAVQPFSVARSSDHKYLGRRLFDTISRSRDKFEAAGFNWRLDGSAAPTRATE